MARRPRTQAAAAPRPRGEVASPSSAPPAPPPSWGARLADAGLIAAFLALAFLLGAFPLRDTDFWWHLRTGDLVRRGAGLPATDWYTFGAAGRRWTDLHWLFEVALSWGFERGGVVGLNLAKCAVTCAALLALLSARRRGWPVWVMVLAWLPALLLLAGRMYVRPETVTLLFLALFLAIVSVWDRRPGLAFVLPVVQVLWVNTQGLFVFGPVVLACGLIDAALRPGTFAPAGRRWWRRIGTAAALTGAACLVNPYGLRGALFPFELLGTMGNPVFYRSIAELMPVVPLFGPDPYSFVGAMGYRSPMVQIHLAVVALGALSFVVPILWRALVRLRSGPCPGEAASRRRKRGPAAAGPAAREGSWRLSPFRLLLFAAFAVMGLKATRNSHQFAAVAGAVTAWNLGEWAAALRRRRIGRRPEAPAPSAAGPRLATLAVLGLLLVAVATGRLYAWEDEGRTLGLGEEPLWYPHEAVRRAGAPGMPGRFVCFHNGHAALYEYAHGPGRKVYCDARLEVIGPELYSRYLELERQIGDDAPGWPEALAALGRPGVLVDNVHAGFARTAANLLAAPGWRCAWFDPIAAVFVPDSYPAARAPVDFAGRHFRRGPASGPGRDPAARLAEAKALFNVAYWLGPKGRADLAGPVLLLGVGHALGCVAAEPAAAEGWKYLGLLESIREPVGTPDRPVARFRLPFDPVFDLSPARAALALRRALEAAPDDAKSLLSLALLAEGLGMTAEALDLYRRLAALDPANQARSVTRDARRMALVQEARLLARLGPEPATSWRNQDELGRALDALLQSGRVRAAAGLLERSYPARARTWDVTDRLATLYLHLGQPGRARASWVAAVQPPRPALVAARVAATFLVETKFSVAREQYQAALAREPELFEAWYGLAVLERDAGRADAARDAARRAAESAPNPVAREAAEAIARLAAPYALASPPDAARSWGEEPGRAGAPGRDG